MKTITTWWVASHITGFFTIHSESTSLLHKGSRGAGFNISRGVTTSVKYSSDTKHHIYFNEHEIPLKQAEVSLNTIKIFYSQFNLTRPISVFHSFDVPLSSGFGASAAGALGTSLCLNSLYHLKLPKQDIFSIAHQAEILGGGGLGDIIGLYQGGYEYRTSEGAPGRGKTFPMTVDKEYQIATASFGKIPTGHVIKNEKWKKTINYTGTKINQEFVKDPTVTNFVKLAQRFSLETNLATKKVKAFYKKYSNKAIEISQIMLGNGLFIFYSDEIPNIPNITKEKICFETIKQLK